MKKSDQLKRLTLNKLTVCRLDNTTIRFIKGGEPILTLCGPDCRKTKEDCTEKNCAIENR